MHRIEIHCSIDVLLRAGALVNVQRLLDADRIVREQPKLARKVAFEMVHGGISPDGKTLTLQAG
jgi:hypothetical protein